VNIKTISLICAVTFFSVVCVMIFVKEKSNKSEKKDPLPASTSQFKEWVKEWEKQRLNN